MIKQRTIRDSVSIEGVGLQTGENVKVTLKSSPANSGINFIRVDLPNKPLIHVQSLGLDDVDYSKERRTNLRAGDVEVQTVEHLMASLMALSIDNMIIELDNSEPPGLDGSALGYLEALRRARPEEQDAPRKILDVDEPIWCEEGEGLIAVFPADEFNVSYLMSYLHHKIGTQFLSFTLDEEKFKSEVAPARTFCLEEEALELLKRGLGKGANYENTLVFGKDGPINNKLRFEDEPARHKILDLMGDLYLVGSQLKGHVVAIKSGHRLNVELVKKLKQRLR